MTDNKNDWAVVPVRDVELLGVWHAAWDARPDEIAGTNMGQNVTVPIGLGVVVPKHKIIEILDSGPASDHRKKEIIKIKEAMAHEMAASVQSVASPPSTDANPTHQEDFSRLLNVAAKSPRSNG